MADILVRVPESIMPMVNAIRDKKSQKLEPSTRKAVVVEAIKNLHKKVCK